MRWRPFSTHSPYRYASTKKKREPEEGEATTKGLIFIEKGGPDKFDKLYKNFSFETFS